MVSIDGGRRVAAGATPMTWTGVVFQVGNVTWAVAARDVIEVMRPLPCEPLAGVPPFVLGVSVVRGSAIPVVDAARLVGGPPAVATRWITLRLAPARAAALAV